MLSAQVDEIFGTIQEVFFSVKPTEGVASASFKPGDKLYINPEKLLPLARFLPGAAPVGGKGKGGKGCAWPPHQLLLYNASHTPLRTPHPRRSPTCWYDVCGLIGAGGKGGKGGKGGNGMGKGALLFD